MAGTAGATANEPLTFSTPLLNLAVPPPEVTHVAALITPLPLMNVWPAVPLAV